MGVQIKPMIASHYFKTGPQTISNDTLTTVFQNKLGWNAGVVLRKQLSEMWSFETGINWIQRNYNLNFYSKRFKAENSLNYQFIGYEIPFQALIYVRLGTKWWINASAGLSANFYPSNVQKSGSMVQDTTFIDYEAKTYRYNWNQWSVISNLGFEYRTKETGNFYLGFSYNRPFAVIGYTSFSVTNRGAGDKLTIPLQGTYLTVDLRYFLPESKYPKK